MAAADKPTCNGAVLCAAAGDDGHVHGGCRFKVVAVCIDTRRHARAVDSVYTSGSGAWGGDISAPIPSLIADLRPSALVGNALYWFLNAASGIIEFHMDRQNLAVIDNPVEPPFANHFRFQNSDHAIRGW